MNSNLRLKDRLALFMEKHGIKHEQMAGILYTPYNTFQKWMRADKDGRGSRKPPACMLLVMEGLEDSAEFRKIAGIKEPSKEKK